MFATKRTFFLMSIEEVSSSTIWTLLYFTVLYEVSFGNWDLKQDREKAPVILQGGVSR